MASSVNGVGRVFYPPAQGGGPPPQKAKAVPAKPDGGGFVAAPGGVGRVFYPPTLEEQDDPDRTDNGLDRDVCTSGRTRAPAARNTRQQLACGADHHPDFNTKQVLVNIHVPRCCTHTEFFNLLMLENR